MRKYRRLTVAEREAKRIRMREAWARGAFANRPKGQLPDAWTAADELRLRALVPHHTAAEIAAILTAECDIPRTPVAVLIRAKRLGLRPGQGTVNARTVGYWFGVDSKTVGNWIARGWLTATQSAGHGSQWCITPAAVEALLRVRPEIVLPAQMPPTRWRSFLEAELHRDPLLTVDQAAQALGVLPSTVQRHLVRGWLPGVRRLEKTGAQHGRWLLRRSALAQFAYRKPFLVGVSGRKRQGAA